MKKYFLDNGLVPEWSAIFATSRMRDLCSDIYKKLMATAEKATNRQFFLERFIQRINI